MNTQDVRTSRRGSRSLAVFTAFALALGGALVATAAPAHAAPAFAITGTLTGKTAEGTTVPLEDVSVYLYQQDATDDSVNYLSAGLTDEDGKYTLAPPAAGKYTMLYNPCDDAETSSCNYDYTQKFLGDAENAEDATLLSLTTAAPTKVTNATVDAATTLSGTITDAGGVALSGVTVTADRPGQYNGPYAVTDDDGTYAIDRVSTKNTILFATFSDDSTPNETRRFFNSAYWKNATSEAGATPLVITAGSVRDDLNLTLTEQPSVRGRAVDSAGRGIANISASLFTSTTADPTWRSPLEGPTFTDEFGWFAQPVVAGTNYRIGYFDDLIGDGSDVNRSTPYATVFYKNSATLNGATSLAATATSRTVLDATTLTPFTGPITLATPLRILQDADDTTMLYVDTQIFSPQDVFVSQQWFRDGVAIADATDASYSYVNADKGAVITEQVTAVRSGSTAATFTSDPFTVPGSTLTATPVPTISGTPIVGETLTAVPGTWTPAPVTLRYVWLRDGSAIGGATSSTYVLTDADLGAQITVAVKGVKTGYYRVTKTSAPTEAVVVAPVAVTSSTPTITGTAKVGNTLTAVAGEWGPEPVTKTYQWYAGETAIAGGTGSTYVLTAAKLGKTITVEVTGSKAGYSSATTRSEAVVVDSGDFTVGTATIGGKAAVGATLSAARGTWAPVTETKFTYQWFHAAGDTAPVAIDGATARTYTVASAYRTQTLTVTITATQDGYTTASATSAPTAAVLGKLKAPTPTITGTAKVGKTLSVRVGTWTTGTKLTYEWLRTKSGSTKVISGAHAKTYKLTTSSKGATIKVRVTGKLSGYSTTLISSKATAKVG